MKNVTEPECKGAMKLIGDYWTLRIISALGQSGPTRFCDVQRAVDNCNPVTLTDRLKKLEAAHLLVRTDETGEKNCVTYDLTSLGREALPIIRAIDKFSAKAEAV
jgi:DNA-binding HxlR family transcriptional regulator